MAPIEFNAPRDVIAGIRPEHLDDARPAGPDAPGLRFTARVAVVESMGAEEYVFFDVPYHGDRHEVVARVDAASGARPGEEIELILDTARLQLFDAAAGGRSLAR